MADSEFEEFRINLENLPQHFGTPAPFYSIVTDLGLEEETPSSKSDVSDLEETPASVECVPIYTNTEEPSPDQPAEITVPACTLPWTGERRRRRLPDIPKHNKNGTPISQNSSGPASLAEELGTGASWPYGPTRPALMLKCGYLLDEDSSPDSERPHSLGDGDSGHSTAHSPTEGPKSLSPLMGSPLDYLQTLEATHRGLHKFVPRHRDEIDVEIGDPLYVQREADDLWCEGVNLRTGRRGVFPSAYAVDVDYSDFDPASVQAKRERYLLGYMGSVETAAHKGTSVVCQAVRKIIGDSGLEPPAQACILEVSDQGLRMVDRIKRSNKCSGPCIDYFYSLKNVSFCAFHPRDHRYLGFITKHPTLQRFACHVFRGRESTRPVAEAVGRAFQRFYQKFIETAYPIEDIYIE